MTITRTMLLGLAVLLSPSVYAATTASDQQVLERDASAIETEIHLFEKISNSVIDAVRSAEHRVSGSKAFDVGFDGQASPAVYRVQTCRGHDVWNVIVDASTNAIVKFDRSQPNSSHVDKLMQRTTRQVGGLDLAAAIAMAEEQATGKAVSATIGEDEGKPVYLMVVVADGRMKQVKIEHRAGEP